MALSIIVTKGTVSKVTDGVWNLSINMVLTDDTIEIINKDYSIRLISGDNRSKKIDQLNAQMQADIDTYKAGQLIYNGIELDTVVSTVGKGLVI